MYKAKDKLLKRQESDQGSWPQFLCPEETALRPGHGSVSRYFQLAGGISFSAACGIQLMSFSLPDIFPICYSKYDLWPAASAPPGACSECSISRPHQDQWNQYSLGTCMHIKVWENLSLHHLQKRLSSSPTLVAGDRPALRKAHGRVPQVRMFPASTHIFPCISHIL